MGVTKESKGAGGGGSERGGVAGIDSPHEAAVTSAAGTAASAT